MSPYETRVRTYQAGRSKILAINCYILFDSNRPIIIAKPDHSRVHATDFYLVLYSVLYSATEHYARCLSLELERDLKVKVVINASGMLAAMTFLNVDGYGETGGDGGRRLRALGMRPQ